LAQLFKGSRKGFSGVSVFRFKFLKLQALRWNLFREKAKRFESGRFYEVWFLLTTWLALFGCHLIFQDPKEVMHYLNLFLFWYFRASTTQSSSCCDRQDQCFRTQAGTIRVTSLLLLQVDSWWSTWNV